MEEVHPVGILVDESAWIELFKEELLFVTKTPNIEATIKIEKNMATSNFNLLLFFVWKNFMGFIFVTS